MMEMMASSIDIIICIVIAGTHHHQHGLVGQDLFGWNVLERKMLCCHDRFTDGV